MPSTRKKRKGYSYAVGRRKTSNARVRYYQSEENDGAVTVNGKPYTEYFPETVSGIVVEPIKLLAQKVGGYFTVRVQGGGIHAQAEAVRHGITRILVQLDENRKGIVKTKGYLSRDPRMKERKKPGLKRARRAAQWSKR